MKEERVSPAESASPVENICLKALAEAYVSLAVVSLCEVPILEIVKGIISDPKCSRAFRYSTASRSLGDSRRSCGVKCPSWILSGVLLSDVVFPLASFPDASRLSASISPHSLPNKSASTQAQLISADTAPRAKYCALPVANAAGSSSTRSAPAYNAAFARAYLSMTAGSPRCT